MKKYILIAIAVIISMSFITKIETNKNKVELTKNIYNLNDELLNSNCYWEETFGNNFVVKRGVACGSRSSLKVWFTNPYSYKIRVAFYLRDTNGNLNPNGPYIVSIRPGERKYHHKCYSNGRYIIVAAKASDYCKFPILR